MLAACHWRGYRMKPISKHSSDKWSLENFCPVWTNKIVRLSTAWKQRSVRLCNVTAANVTLAIPHLGQEDRMGQRPWWQPLRALCLGKCKQGWIGLHN